MVNNYMVIKRNQFQIILVIGLICMFLLMRLGVDRNNSFIDIYNGAYNERRFLAIYLFIFLISIFPILRELYMIEKITRFNNKWSFLIQSYKKVMEMAVLYSGIVTIGWLLIVGTGTKDWSERGNLIFILCVFVTQIIGWILVGVFEVSVYIFLKNIPLTFVFCETIMILLNLSLYVSGSSEYVTYARLYDFMYGASLQNSIIKTISIGFLNIFLIMLLFFVGYYKFSKNDLLSGGKNK